MATVTDLSSGATAYGISSDPRAQRYAQEYLGSEGEDFGASLRQLLGTNGYEADKDAYLSALDREYNAEQAQQNRDWQERMSNTAYQRAVADMKKAGINPLMAFQQGGASSPSGSSASGSSQDSTSSFLPSLVSGIAHIMAGLFILGKSPAKVKDTSAIHESIKKDFREHYRKPTDYGSYVGSRYPVRRYR